MIEADVIEYLGWCLGFWSLGYIAGFKVLAIKKFADSI